MDIKMRRFKQQLPLEESLEILKTSTSGVLALKGNEEYPYAVPVSFAYDGKYIYVHSAIAGHKIDCLLYNPKVSFCVVCQDRIVSEEFTTYYKSVIVFGTATFASEKSELEYGLKLLADKYSPGIDCKAEIGSCINRIAVIKISIDSISGKEAVELSRTRNQ